MEEKQICTKCGKELPATLDFFYFRKKETKLFKFCKDCACKDVAKYKDTHYGYWRKYYIHKDDPWKARRKPMKDGKLQCATCKEWFPADTQHFHKDKKRYHGLSCSCKWCVNTTKSKYPIRSEYNRQYYKKQRQQNPNFRISQNIQVTIWSALFKKYCRNMAQKYTSCSINKLKTHIESLWVKGMSWENYGVRKGVWHLKYKITPTSLDLTDPANQLKCFYYKNITPVLNNIKPTNNGTIKSTQTITRR